jgi:glycerol-1-phosphate dehydrogenase [NAD(P)+]
MRIDAKQYGGACSCGDEHQMETRLCVIEENALAAFETYMEEAGVIGRRCAVYDTHTYEAKNLIRPYAEQEIILDPDYLHANEISTAEVLKQLEKEATVLIAVGGGTIHDIVRYCANERDIPFIAVPTAASCDGFCSTVAAMTWEGYKNTMNCVAPALVVADLSVIREAPQYLTNSGVGDIIGKYTALADWRIAHAVTGEKVCERIYSVMKDATDCVWDHARGTLTGDTAAYEAVTYGLIMSGLAMQMLKTSRPASGGEHHISHMIETEPEAFASHSDALHGEKVGVGTVLASAEYHRLAETKDIAHFVIPYVPIDQDRLRAFWGETLYPIAKRENEKDCLAGVTAEGIVKAWPEIRRVIAQIPPAAEVDRLLADLGAKHTLSDIGIDEDKRQTILDESPLIRNRLTLMRMRRMIRV